MSTLNGSYMGASLLGGLGMRGSLGAAPAVTLTDSGQAAVKLEEADRYYALQTAKEKKKEKAAGPGFFESFAAALQAGKGAPLPQIYTPGSMLNTSLVVTPDPVSGFVPAPAMSITRTPGWVPIVAGVVVVGGLLVALTKLARS